MKKNKKILLSLLVLGASASLCAQNGSPRGSTVQGETFDIFGYPRAITTRVGDFLGKTYPNFFGTQGNVVEKVIIAGVPTLTLYGFGRMVSFGVRVPVVPGSRMIKPALLMLGLYGAHKGASGFEEEGSLADRTKKVLRNTGLSVSDALRNTTISLFGNGSDADDLRPELTAVQNFVTDLSGQVASLQGSVEELHNKVNIKSE